MLFRSVASEVANAIGLKNVTTNHIRVEELKLKFDFVVSRAVMPLGDIIRITKKNFEKEQHNALPNGWICLKGGELEREIDKFKSVASEFDISDYYEEEYFKEKKIVYVPHMG